MSLITHRLTRITLSALALLVAANLSRAQSAAPAAPVAVAAAAAPAPESSTDRYFKQLKQPAPWFTWGADFRVRNEYYHNSVTLAPNALNEQDVLRVRGRISAAVTATPTLTFNTRLAAEARYWVNPAFVGACKNRTGWEERYLIFDALSAKWTKAGDVPVTLTIGRQDIQLGDPLDWWLVMDGTPNEGSWTNFFDAARLVADVKSIKTKFDVIALVQNVQPDAWLPVIGNSDNYPLTDQKEKGVILYASNTSLPNTQIDGYFIAKHDEQRWCTVAGVKRLSGDNADMYTFGSKITGTPTPHWRYSLEGALQFGSKEDRVSGVFAERDLRAYGAKGRLTYSFKDPLNNQLFLSGELLSGDDPTTTDTDEMFDVLWGRWPLWSELYIYSYIQETNGRIAQMNNLARFGGGWTSAPVKGSTLSFAYQALFAPQSTPTRAVTPSLFSRDGNFRGHYLQAFMKRQFNKYLSGHLWAEFVWQGDYYTQGEVMTFLRAELMIGF